jgi:hypothetical protein
MQATNGAPPDDDGSPLAIDLFDEARDTAVELAKRHNVSTGDVVARALGLLWLLDTEARNGGRVVVEDKSGELHPININLRPGDAGANADQGR